MSSHHPFSLCSCERWNAAIYPLRVSVQQVRRMAEIQRNNEKESDTDTVKGKRKQIIRLLVAGIPRTVTLSLKHE